MIVNLVDAIGERLVQEFEAISLARAFGNRMVRGKYYSTTEQLDDRAGEILIECQRMGIDIIERLDLSEIII